MIEEKRIIMNKEELLEKLTLHMNVKIIDIKRRNRTQEFILILE